MIHHQTAILPQTNPAQPSHPFQTSVNSFA
jgi:hypothetical protein